MKTETPETDNAGKLDFKKVPVTIPQEEQPQAIQIRTPDDFILEAMRSGKSESIELMERLFALKERFDAKQAKAAFDEALSKFQSMIPPIKKNKKGYDGNYTYAELDKIVEVIKTPLFECGFSYKYKFRVIENVSLENDRNGTINQIIEATQELKFEKEKISKLEKLLRKILLNKQVEVTCILTHKQGHSEETTMLGPLDDSGFKNDIQSLGSSATYLERYTLIGSLGLVTADTDNDGRKPKQLKAIGEPRYKKYVEAITEGKVTVDEAVKSEADKGNAFSEDQLKGLRTIEDVKKKGK